MTALSLIEDPLFLLLANIQQERYFEQFKASGYDYYTLLKLKHKDHADFIKLLEIKVIQNWINNRIYIEI